MASMTRTIIRDNRRKVAVAYARFSSNNQREESIDAQLRAIREYCEKENIELVAEYIDEAVSGKTDNREDFQKMINQLLKGHVQADYVLVHKFNRFARSKFDSALYKKKLKDVNTKVVSVTQKIDDTPEGELLEGFLETIDQYYSANLAAEVRKGLRENALKGKHAGGQVLFGYSLDENGYYIPNENAKIVRRIFEEYVAGVPKTVICERLNNEGYRNQRGCRFTPRTVYDLLRNEKYIGNYVYTIDKKETIRLDGIIQNPPIDMKLWSETQQLCKEAAEKVHGRQRTKERFYYLTGRAFCGECGSRICANGSKRSGGHKNKHGKLNYYYQCVGKIKEKNSCTNTGINKDWIEPKVLNVVLSVIMDKNYIKKFAHTAYNEILAMRKKPAVSTVDLKKELVQITKQQERLRDLYIDGNMSKDILDEKNGELNRRRFQIEDELEKRKNIIESEDITAEDIEEFITQYVDNILEHYDKADEEFKRIIFHTFVEKVVISKEKVTVHIHTPFSRMDGGDNVRFSGVLHRLSTVKIVCSFRRKKRNERIDE